MRENRTRSYVTPIIREIGGRTQMILSGSLSVASYDRATASGTGSWTGRPSICRVDGLQRRIRVCDRRVSPEAHPAIKPDGTGNVTDSHIAWRTTRGAAYVPSPIMAGRFLLVVADSGIASCFGAKTGRRHWQERLPGGHSPSPVSADGLVYFTSDLGVTSVIRPGETFEVVAQNKLGEPVSASPAISKGNSSFAPTNTSTASASR